MPCGLCGSEVPLQQSAWLSPVAAAWPVGGGGFVEGCGLRSVLTACRWTYRGIQRECLVLSQMQSDN